MKATVTIVSPDGPRRVEAEVDEYGDVAVPVTNTRAVVLGRRLERQRNESVYIAFWVLPDREDHANEWHALFSHIPKEQRIFAAMMQGLDIEPELPADVLNLDGVSVIRVDLGQHLTEHAVIIPERLVP